MKAKTALLAALGAALLLAGACVPIPVSESCQRRISDCLGACGPAGSRTQPDGMATGDTWDTRNDCQQRCHEICGGESDPPPTPSEAENAFRP